MSAEGIFIDVSGAPAHEREVRTIVLKLVICFVLASLSQLPLMILDPNQQLPGHVRGAYVGCVFATLLFVSFGLSALDARKRERCIQLAPYGLTLAQAKERVFARLHRPWWTHPDFWAWVSLAFAFVAPITIVANERAIVVSLGGVDLGGYQRWDNTIPETSAIVIGVALLLNAARLYKRGLSLWAFSVPFFVWVVLLPGLLLFYFWGASGLLSYDARPSPLPHTNRDAVLFLFGYVPVISLGVASLWPTVRRFYARTRDRFTRLMEVVQLPSAQHALTRDKRQPVLYLRSFHIDQTWVWDGATGKNAMSRRLEEAVAAPLRELGPFVGIGKPGELAVTGAARSYYSNDKWQAAIVDLMGRAGFIVVVIGATESLAWEVTTIRARNDTGKVIWIVPPDHTNAALLREKLRDAFAHTPYEAAARGADFSRAMAVHAVGADQLAVISSNRNTSGEYEAATYAAVYGLTRHLIEPASRQS